MITVSLLFPSPPLSLVQGFLPSPLPYLLRLFLRGTVPSQTIPAPRIYEDQAGPVVCEAGMERRV